MAKWGETHEIMAQKKIKDKNRMKYWTSCEQQQEKVQQNIKNGLIKNVQRSL